MGILLPLGAALIVIGAAGSAAACYGNAIFDGGETSTVASGMQGQTDAPANAGDDGSDRSTWRRSPGLRWRSAWCASALESATGAGRFRPKCGPPTV